MANYGRKPVVKPDYPLKTLEQELERLEEDKNTVESAIVDQTKRLNELQLQRSVLFDHRSQVVTAIATMKGMKS